MKDTVNTVTGAVTAALILLITNAIALFTENPELTVADIKQSTWIVLVGGGLVAFLKDYQALSFRRMVNNITNAAPMIAVLAIALVAANDARAQTVTLTTDVVQADGQATPTLTWDTVPPADDCVASGDWSGSKGPSGTETQPTTLVSVTYNLTCTWLAGGTAVLTWTPPTQNIDGSTLTDLDRYHVYYGTVSGGPYPTMLVLNDPTADTYTINNLTAGVCFFNITAVNANGVESDPSNEASTTIDDVQAVESTGTVVNPQPESITDLASDQ